jgi:hypothetical protein
MEDFIGKEKYQKLKIYPQGERMRMTKNCGERPAMDVSLFEQLALDIYRDVLDGEIGEYEQSERFDALAGSSIAAAKAFVKKLNEHYEEEDEL